MTVPRNLEVSCGKAEIRGGDREAKPTSDSEDAYSGENECVHRG